ncbi:hypothetical protein QBC40DRAFT_289220 [Triangularia verruculosa]|uniref:Cell cycle control protein n=1 Tax=Triangularia verruculosa TaxID=2587418 RepID=A0AAN6X8D7_9PEZI|nr:hypothetical protein QBC40DRAFT_289220 [Triangularia verruculosa]
MDRGSPDLGFYSSDNHDDSEPDPEPGSESELDSDQDRDYDSLEEHDDHDDHQELERELEHRLHHLRHFLGFDFAAAAAAAANAQNEYMDGFFDDNDSFDDESYLEDVDQNIDELEELHEDDFRFLYSDEEDIVNRASTEGGSEDSLFVDQRPSSPNRLPPIAQLLPELGGPHFGSRRVDHRLAQYQQANRESSFGLESLDSDDLAAWDELIEVEMEARPPRRPRAAAAAGRSMTPAANPVVIDLTGDDEENEQPRANPHPNPRRQTLSHRTPSLTRSDGSLLGNHGAADIIDLTMDDPAPPPPRRHNSSRAQARFNVPRPPQDQVLVVEDDEDEEDNIPAGPRMIGQMLHQLQDRLRPAVFGVWGLHDLAMLGRRSANNPLGAHGPNLNYGLHRGGQERPAPPKPAHVPPKPAREGFTRATGEAVEDVAVCPGCEEELKYDPDESRADMPPQKRARTKKDNEEHHFWAVKECGHVYCKSCYEGRGKSKLKRAHFRPGPGKSKILCNVPDCESEVGSKTAWVGLFL